MNGSVLIYEASSGGHFLHFVRHLVIETHRRGRPAHVVVPRGVEESDEFRSILDPLAESFVLHVVPAPLSPSGLAEQAREIGAEVAIVPNGDSMIYRLKARDFRASGCNFGFLIMARPDRAPLSLKTIAKRIYLARVRRFDNVRVSLLTHARVPESGEWRGEAPDPVSVEDVDSDWEGRNDLLKWVRGRRMFLLIGVIQPWKNPTLVVNSFRRASLAESCLVIAGPQSSAVAEELSLLVQDDDAEVLLFNSLLSDGQINDLVRDAYAVVLAYSTHAPNSTATKAEALGTRIVAAGSKAFLANLDFVGATYVGSTLCEEGLVRSMQRTVSQSGSTPVPLATTADFATALLDQFGGKC